MDSFDSSPQKKLEAAASLARERASTSPSLLTGMLPPGGLKPHHSGTRNTAFSKDNRRPLGKADSRVRRGNTSGVGRPATAPAHHGHRRQSANPNSSVGDTSLEAPGPEMFPRTQRLAREHAISSLNQAAGLQLQTATTNGPLAKSASRPTSTGVAAEEITEPHLVRLSPIGKTYVSYFVRAKPYVSYVAEGKISQAEIDEMKKRLDFEYARACALEAELEELKLAFLKYHEHVLEEKNAHAGSVVVVGGKEGDATHDGTEDPDKKEALKTKLVMRLMFLSSKGAGDTRKSVVGSDLEAGEDDGELSNLRSKNEELEALVAALKAERGNRFAQDQALARAREKEGKQTDKDLCTCTDALARLKEEAADMESALNARIAELEQSLHACECAHVARDKQMRRQSLHAEDGGHHSSSDEEEEGGSTEAETPKKKKKQAKKKKAKMSRAMGYMMKYVNTDPKSPLRKSNTSGTVQLRKIIYDILEKKAVQEETDERVEGHMRPTSSLAEFTEDYFLRTYGLPKIARKELIKQLTCIDVHRGDDKRIRMMALLIGIEKPEVYNVKMSHVFMRVLRRIFPEIKNIDERLAKYTPENGGHANEYVSRKVAVSALLGVDPHSTENHRLTPNTWTAPHLLSICTPEDLVGVLLARIDALPTNKIHNSDVLDVDDVFWAVLEFIQERAELHMKKVQDLFQSFGLQPVQGGEMEYAHFMKIADFCVLKQHDAASSNAGGDEAVARRRLLAYAPLNKTSVMEIFERIHEVLDISEDDELPKDLGQIVSMCCYQGGLYLPPSQLVPEKNEAEAFLAEEAEQVRR